MSRIDTAPLLLYRAVKHKKMGYDHKENIGTGVMRVVTVENYIKSIRGNLSMQSEQLTHRLGELVKLKFDPNVGLLDFEMFVEPTRHEISIMMFSMDKSANEVFGDDNELFSGSTEVLQDIRYYSLMPGVDDDDLDEDEYRRLDDEFFEFYEANWQNGLERMESEAFIEWFVRCWNAVDGNNVSLPCYVGLHDHGQSFDLKQGKWIPGEEKFDGE